MFKRTFLVGLGLMNWGRERAREVAADLVARGQVEASRRDGVLGDVLDAFDRRVPLTGSGARPAAGLQRRLGQAMESLPLATKEDLKVLEERLRNELSPTARGGSRPS